MTSRPPSLRPDDGLDDLPAALPRLDGHLLRIIAGGRAPARPMGKVARGREQRYRMFLDALGVAVYTTDEDGRITFFNEAAADFWGRRPALGEEWCGSLRIYTPAGEHLPHDQCPMAVALKENRPVRGEEAVAERPDGSRVWFLAFPTPLRDDRGALIGAVNVLVDVTARRRIEADLRRTTTALESSNSVKDQFLGLVSHELRTPVTTIFGNARLLHDRAAVLPETTKAAMVADIAEDAERLHEIIENLLLLTRLGSGPQPDLEPQVLERVIHRTIRAYRRRRPRRTIVVPAEVDGTIVEADRTWLELLAENLLGNADKYSPPDAPIEVQLRCRGEWIEVAVLDRGLGLDDAAPEELFKPFYRGERARTSANGMGVGLAVCQRIVDALGGRIWARPREGGGAEVGFALPIVRDLDEALPA